MGADLDSQWSLQCPHSAGNCMKEGRSHVEGGAT